MSLALVLPMFTPSLWGALPAPSLWEWRADYAHSVELLPLPPPAWAIAPVVVQGSVALLPLIDDVIDYDDLRLQLRDIPGQPSGSWRSLVFNGEIHTLVDDDYIRGQLGALKDVTSQRSTGALRLRAPWDGEASYRANKWNNYPVSNYTVRDYYMAGTTKERMLECCVDGRWVCRD